MTNHQDQNFSEVEIANGNEELDQPKAEENINEQNQIDPKDELIKKLEEQIESLKDSWARERAEFSNYRKRMQIEILKAKDSGIEEFVKHLLNIIDNLEMVLSSSRTESQELKNFIFGVEMIRDEFLRVLSQFSIFPTVIKGDKFNPHFMEAIDVEYRKDMKEETVLEVYKKAYIRFDVNNKEKKNVLRLASVKVGKPIPDQNHTEKNDNHKQILDSNTIN